MIPTFVFGFLGVQVLKWRYTDTSVRLNVVQTKADERQNFIRILIAIGIISVFILFFLSVAYFVLVIVWTSISAPDITSAIVVPSGQMSAAFSIDRDENYIPAAIVTSSQDGLYSMGWLHASERYYQMDLNRRSARGNLSSLLGAKAEQHDIFYRTLGFGVAAQNTYDSLSDPSKAKLAAYVAGVNDYMKASPVVLPHELRTWGYGYETWSALDTIAVLKMYQWVNSGNYFHELTRLRLLVDKGFTPAQAKAFDPPYPLDTSAFSSFAPTELEESTVNIEGNMAAENSSIAFEEVRVAELKASLGSNSSTAIDVNSLEDLHFGWDPNYLSSGNRHKGSSLSLMTFKETTGSNQYPLGGASIKGHLSAPTEYMIMQVDDVAAKKTANGQTIPGIPGFWNGRNQFGAWNVVPMGGDNTDIFVLKESVAGVSYIHNGAVVVYTSRTETLATGKTITVKESLYGPIINSAIQNAPGLGAPLALKWTGHFNDSTIDWLLNSWTTTTPEEFTDLTVSSLNCPPSSVAYTSLASFPTFIQAGRVPIRANGHTGLFPVQGNGTYDWSAWGTVFNIARWPNTKFFVIGGGRLAGRGYRHKVGLDFEDEFTSKRLHSLLADLVAKGKTITYENFQTIMNDRYDALYSSFLPFIKTLPDSAAKTVLTEWNGICDGLLSQCGLWKAWYWELTKLGENANVGVRYWDKPRFILAALQSNDAVCGTGGCVAFANAALQTVFLAGYSATKPVTFKHHLLEGTAWDCLCNRYSSIGGSSHSVAPAVDSDPTRSEVRQACTYRQINDWNAKTGGFTWGIPLGNSGWQWLRYYMYDSYMTTWANNGWMSMSFTTKKTSSQRVGK